MKRLQEKQASEATHYQQRNRDRTIAGLIGGQGGERAQPTVITVFEPGPYVSSPEVRYLQ